MSPLIIANWKMNLTFNEAIFLATSLTEQSFSRQLIIAPPAPYIGYLKAHFEQIDFCAQDVSSKNEFGSYTGENTAKFFKSCGVNYAIIGHSERRNLCKEDDDIVRVKAQNCLDNDITPIICIGEPLEIRQNKSYPEFLLNQLKQSAPQTDKEIIIAYEPLWSIGTGVVPTIEEISEVFALIRGLEKKIKLVYGGSVNSKNCEELLKISGISGLLVGGASLNKEELFKILNS